MKRTFMILASMSAALLLSTLKVAEGQTLNNGGVSSSGSISTPRPINPAAGTTNPSARATQTLNPYLGSTPDAELVPGVLKLSLEDAVARGLKYNLGLIDSQQADASVRAQRRRALSLLLPQISARAQETFQQLSYQELGLRLPTKAGFQLPPSSGAFGYSEARIVAQSAIVNMELLDRYKSQKMLEVASALSTKDSRDVVTFAVGSAFFQVVASQARLNTTDAALSSAQELQRQVTDQYNAELSPEIDSIRAQVELKTAEQRVVDATNDLEKDKLTLDRITGLSLQQAWTPSQVYAYTPLVELEDASSPRSQTRSDLASLQVTVYAAELGVKAAKAERRPVVSFEADYGGAGTNPAKFTQTYTVTGGISVPLFTSGRIRSDVDEAQAALVQKRAEYRDLQGRVEYDRQVAILDVKSSESAVKVAATNDALARRALTQSQDRFRNGVTNYLEVVQAEATLVAAKENSIASLFSYNVAKISLARALGSTESRLPALFDTK